MQEIKSRGLTRDAIKMIAMLTMFFNHFSHVFLTAGTYPAEFLKGIGYFTEMCIRDRDTMDAGMETDIKGYLQKTFTSGKGGGG